MRVLMGIGAIGLTLMAVSADARVIAPPAEAAATRNAPGAASEAAPCPLTLQFGSYAMGIDAGALSRIDALLARDRAVVHVDRQRWGREGEVTLCVHTRRSGDVQRIARAVRRLVPTSPRGPVSAATPAGPLWTINQRGFGG